MTGSKTDETIPVRIIVTGSTVASAFGEVTVVRWTKQGKTQRAFKILGIIWGIMFLSLFIPVLHFIVSPLLFIGGPIAAIITYRQSEQIKKTELGCPSCGGKVSILASKVEWPLNSRCDGCGQFVRIERS